jgi:hypothetical protein
MAPVIRITEGTWNRLKQWAEPLEDGPEDALKKVLNAAEKQIRGGEISNLLKEGELNSMPTRIKKGSKLPEKAYRHPILETLFEMGGSAPTSDVLKNIEKKMKQQFSDVDLQSVSSGETRWSNTAKWERKTLVKEGLLKSGSPKGIWELAEKGFHVVKNSH